ncbi:MAG: DVUA0089 family protein [Treponema sp.]|jgi:hypothetical protein|nr:DVUA0089 family protein [Treponema sp.]
MKRDKLLLVFIFFSGLSVLGGQNSADPLPRLDAAVQSLAVSLQKAIPGQGQKLALDQWVYRDSIPDLGFYWAAQLTEELTNIPGRTFSLVDFGSEGAGWIIAGEIIEAGGFIRVYTRLRRVSDNSIQTVLHADFPRDEYIVAMLAGGARGGSSSSVPRDSYEPDSLNRPMRAEIGTSENRSSVSRTLHGSGDEDFFLLTPDRDGRLVVETTGGMDTFMELYRPGSGSPIARDDDDGEETNAKISCNVNAGGGYIAKIRGYDNNETGRYTFHAYMVEGPIPDEYEDDNEFSLAKDISVGIPQQHTFTNANDVDWVKFPVSRAGSYVIRARGVNSRELDTCVELYDSNHKLIAEDDDGGEQYDSRLSVNLRTGTYYVSIRSLDDEPDEPYTVSINAE